MDLSVELSHFFFISDIQSEKISGIFCKFIRVKKNLFTSKSNIKLCTGITRRHP